MTLTNLATIFGPNLLRPGGAGLEINLAAMDVVTPVSVVLYYLNCPEEYFDEGALRTSPNSTAIAGNGADRRQSAGMSSLEPSHRGSNSQLLALAKDQRSFEEAPGKLLRRSRRASGRGVGSSKTSSSSSIKGSATGKSTSVTSIISKETVI